MGEKRAREVTRRGKYLNGEYARFADDLVVLDLPRNVVGRLSGENGAGLGYSRRMGHSRRGRSR